MYKLLIATAFASAIACSAAYAADITQAPPQAPTVETPPGFTWAGAYAGIRGGATFVNGDFDIPGVGSRSDDINGGGIGGFIGYNWQFQNNVVLGLEGDLNYNWNKKTIAPGIDVGTDIDGSIRARLGYAFDRALLYAAGGWEATRGFVDTGSKDTSTFNGWTIGAGLDYAFTDKIFGRLEYRFTDFGDKHLNGVDVSLKQNAVMVGVGVKFW
ncbi:porin family protein [Rhizobium calliandrae]|uniref:Porin family protein n=1 Tax=Rhizobium calliandrae TaxID=1312182 RepID=A0ABT7KRJ6_9HYPH|nr:outer membrane protein [Rhizobium calliandrae]MDL2410690.1 porin family protein [Rhizobium calliandrae]